jgi:hypothetical protein
LLFVQPAWALSPDTVAAIGEASTDITSRDRCNSLITGRSGDSSLKILNSIVMLGQQSCPAPRPNQPKCPGLREVFTEDPPNANAVSILQGGLSGSTALFKGFEEGRSVSSDFPVGKEPNPGLSPLEAQVLILLHELAHTTGALGDDSRDAGIAQAFNFDIVRRCIRPPPDPPHLKGFSGSSICPGVPFVAYGEQQLSWKTVSTETHYQIQEAPVGTVDWDTVPTTWGLPGIGFDAPVLASNTFSTINGPDGNGPFGYGPTGGWYTRVAYGSPDDPSYDALVISRPAIGSTLDRIRSCDELGCGDWSPPVLIPFTFCTILW